MSVKIRLKRSSPWKAPQKRLYLLFTAEILIRF